jgi:hypothetical protein
MVVSLYVMGIAGNFKGIEDFLTMMLVFPVNKLILASVTLAWLSS